MTQKERTTPSDPKNNPKLEPAGKAVAQVVTEIEKAFGKGAIMYLENGAVENISSVPSGSVSLDRALGIGGYPRGRIVEIYGPESSGKTTLTLHAIAEVQAQGGVAAFIDAEHAFDTRYAKALGVDTASLLVSQPDCGEQALDIAEVLTKSGAIDLVVIDSVAALVPRAEIEGDMGDAHMGLQARLMSQALRKLTAISHKTNTTFIFINQLRQKIGVTFGNPETTTGGNALKFYASVRLDVRRVGKVSVGEETVGNRTRVKVVKNKCARPFAEAEFDIRWGTGIDVTTDLLDLAVEAGLVTKNGAYYTFENRALGQGRENARAALLEAPALHSRLAGLMGVQNPRSAGGPEVAAEPVKLEPNHSAPAKAEPAKAEPAKGETSKSDLGKATAQKAVAKGDAKPGQKQAA
ncbi:MAG: recombinase RecA [Pseudomonadota bacterium]|jgi:recombination protein RecA